MRLLLPASLSLLLLLPAAHAQLLNADDFFNDGAHSYLTNNIPQALKTVQTGLQQYPDDDHLKKLYELLKQQQKQQQQQQQQQQQNQQNQQNQQQQQQKNQQDQNKQQQNQQNQSQQQQQQQQQQNSGQKDQPDQTQANQANEKQNEQGGETNDQAQAAQMTKMTPEEAKRLLDQQKNDEQVLVMKPQVKPPDTTHPIKDW
jgi:Ca-activated chloride channel family protein